MAPSGAPGRCRGALSRTRGRAGVLSCARAVTLLLLIAHAWAPILCAELSVDPEQRPSYTYESSPPPPPCINRVRGMSAEMFRQEYADKRAVILIAVPGHDNSHVRRKWTSEWLGEQYGEAPVKVDPPHVTSAVGYSDHAVPLREFLRYLVVWGEEGGAEGDEGGGGESAGEWGEEPGASSVGLKAGLGADGEGGEEEGDVEGAADGKDAEVCESNATRGEGGGGGVGEGSPGARRVARAHGANYVFDPIFFDHPTVRPLTDRGEYQRVEYLDHHPHLGLVLGGKGMGLPFHRHSEAWLELIAGRKAWTLAAPGVPLNHNPFDLYDHRQNLSYISTIPNGSDHRQPRSQHQEERNPPTQGHNQREHEACSFIQEPGDIVYLPDGFRHATVNLADFTLGISQQRCLTGERKRTN